MPNARTRRKRIAPLPGTVDLSDWEGKLPLPQEGGDLVINTVDPTPNMLVTDFTMEIQPDSDTVALVLTRDMVVKVVGKNTGRLYIFSGAGSVIDDVDRLDAETMLQKGRNISCCGSQSTPYFLVLGR